MPIYTQIWGHPTKAILILGVLVLGEASISEESDSTPPIRTDVMFQLMSNQMVDVVCNAPEFRACFDVPYTECSRELRKMLADCRADLSGELPDLI